jgi:general secretion pathway protein G
MIGEAEWGMRSTADEPDASSWGGGNVFDVFSHSGRVGLNGVPYTEW